MCCAPAEALEICILKEKGQKLEAEKNNYYKKNDDLQVGFDKVKDEIMLLCSFIRISSQETIKPPEKKLEKPGLYSLG